jgi:hypothetical protein
VKKLKIADPNHRDGVGVRVYDIFNPQIIKKLVH